MNDTWDWRVVARLKSEVVEPLKDRFVDREEVVDLIALALVSGEHLFLHGPPGTAKSALIREFSAALHGNYFEYMLTRFSEPNELFGPIDLVKLRAGTVASVTSGMLPEAEIVFLDELFNANSAILNNLLTVLNERVYRRGAESYRLPLLSLFSASNALAEDETLKALFDRFLLRCHVENLKREAMPRLLAAGWALETTQPPQSSVTAEDLRGIARQIPKIELSSVLEPYGEAVWKLRDLGISLSDRRVVKILKLVAASALLCERSRAEPSDLWVLRYVWDHEQQIEPLAALTQGFLEPYPASDRAHPRSRTRAAPDPEDLARRIERLATAVGDADRLSLLELARLREQSADLQDQICWLPEGPARTHLQQRIGVILERLGST